MDLYGIRPSLDTTTSAKQQQNPEKNLCGLEKLQTDDDVLIPHIIINFKLIRSP